MNYFSVLMVVGVVAFCAWIWYEIHRAPVEHDDMTQQDDKAVDACVKASKKA